MIATALIVGLGVGYVWGTTMAVKSSELENCTVTAYAVWSILIVHNSTTVGGTTTSSSIVTTFQTSGYPRATTNNYTGTFTGPIALWNSTTCS